MLPKTLALIDDDPEYTEFLSQYLQERGVAVTVYANSNDLLSTDLAYGFDFYVVDLMLPGVDGVNLIDLLRRRTQVGILVVSGRLADDVFKQVIGVGADMYLTKPVQFEQVALAVQAVHRRVHPPGQHETAWKLDQRARQLVAPDGARADLSEADMALLGCFLDAAGQAVSRDTLRASLGALLGSEAGGDLNATIYRLRRRIERSTPIAVPLQSRSRIGYVFNAQLKAV